MHAMCLRRKVHRRQSQPPQQSDDTRLPPSDIDSNPTVANGVWLVAKWHVESSNLLQCAAASLGSVRMCWVAIVSFYLTARSALECWHDWEVPQSALERLLCNDWKWDTKKKNWYTLVWLTIARYTRSENKPTRLWWEWQECTTRNSAASHYFWPQKKKGVTTERWLYLVAERQIKLHDLN